MVLFIGLVVGVLIVVMVIGICVVALRVFPERKKSVKHGDGRYSIGPVPDFYGRPHGDHFGRAGPWP